MFPVTERVTIDSDGWRLVGDLALPGSAAPTAAVALFNRAAGDRRAHGPLIDRLVTHGIASLSIDLRAHGESTNLGRFEPGAGRAILDGSEHDVVAALQFLRRDRRIDPARIGVVGASYSGEVMMEAARQTGYAAAYVALSPGSLSDPSIAAIDREHLAFLLVAARHERYLKEVVAALREQSRSADFLEVSGTEHATGLFVSHPGLADVIAVWFRQKLNRGPS